MYGKDRSKQASNSIYSKQCHTRRQSSLFIPDLSFPISTLPRPVPSFLVVFWTCSLLSRTCSFLFIPISGLPSPILSCPRPVLASLIITALSPVLFYQDLSRSTSFIYRSPIRSPCSAGTCPPVSSPLITIQSTWPCPCMSFLCTIRPVTLLLFLFQAAVWSAPRLYRQKRAAQGYGLTGLGLGQASYFTGLDNATPQQGPLYTIHNLCTLYQLITAVFDIYTT